MAGRFNLEADATESSKHEKRRLQARVFDSDGNGRFGDPSDLVLFDKNWDGKFSRFSEQTTMFRGLPLGKGSYSISSNLAGTQFQVRKQKGRGRAEFLFNSGWEVDQCDFLFVSDKGLAFPVRLKDDEKTLSIPSGKYYVSSLLLTLHGPEGKEVWNYLFSQIPDLKKRKGYQIRNGQTTEIPLIGRLDFRVHIGKEEKKNCARTIPKDGTRIGDRKWLIFES